MKKDKKLRKEKEQSKTIYIIFSLSFNKNENGKLEASAFFEAINKQFTIFYSKIIENNYIIILEHELKYNKKINNPIILVCQTNDLKYYIEFNNYEGNFIYKTKIYKDEYEFPNQISNSEKFDNFYISLTEKKKELLDQLFSDSILLYSKRNEFKMLIKLFTKINNNENLRSKLLGEFRKLNQDFKPEKDDPKKKYIIFDKELGKYKDDLITIYESYNNSKKNYTLENCDFYGLLFCYFNNYDHQKFLELFQKLFNNSKDIVFEILLIYTFHLKNPLFENEQDECNKQFFIEFMKYTMKKTYDEFYQRCIYYYKDIYTFLEAVDSNKDSIILMDKFEPIKIGDNFDNYSINDINKILYNILDFCRNENKLILIFDNSFWEKFIKLYQNPTLENIENCYEMEKLFNIYNDLKSKLNNNEKEYEDSSEIQFEYLLNRNIIKYINKQPNIQNKDIIDLIMKYNIYYLDEKYIEKRNTEIFDKININSVDDIFIEKFRKCCFENLFKNKIENYFSKLIDKIEKFSHFYIVIDLINMKEINNRNDGKAELLLKKLKNKYDLLIQKENISFEKKEDNDNIIKSLSKLTYFFYNNDKKKDSFLKAYIDKLDIKIKNRIYIEIIKNVKHEKNNEINDYIRGKFLSNLEKGDKDENLKEFIFIIKEIPEDFYLNIMEEISGNYIINNEIFFDKINSLQISLLVNLYKNELLKYEYSNIFLKKSKLELKNIENKIETGEILIKQYNNLLKIEREEDILNRLNLLKIVNKAFNPKEKYVYIKLKLEDINKKIEKLKYISKSLRIYHDKIKASEISNIEEIVKIYEKGTISEYESKNIETYLLELELVNRINDVGNKKIFIYFYNDCKEVEQDKRFENAYNKLKNFIQDSNFNETEFKKIMEDQINCEKYEKEIMELGNIFNENQNIDEKTRNKNKKISILFQIKVIKDDINSIFDFFSYFKEDNKEWENFLCAKYKDIDKLENEKQIEILEELKSKNIYDYEKKDNYIEFFNCLFKKKKAYDFLLNNTIENINALQEKIDPNYGTITDQDILDTIDCVGIFMEIKKLNNNFERLNHIKKIMKDENLIKFKNFSYNYISIIELNENSHFSIGIFNEVKAIITKAKFFFMKYTEEFNYFIDHGNRNIEKKTTTIKHLIYLKNRIYIPKKCKENQTDKRLDLANKKYECLTRFKIIVENIESIYNYMCRLRIKGSNLPININILIEYPNIQYQLENNSRNFDEIKKFLFDAENNLNIQLDSFYKNYINLRFLFSGQFDSIIKHMEGTLNINYFLRYILNNTDDEVKNGEKSFIYSTKDYINKLDLYNKESFQNISKYIDSVFSNNNSSIEKHYERIRIKSKNNLKGIYLYSSSSKSMEGDILYFFLEHTKTIPIAQNILISNKETSYEEMKAFFNRAILCEYYTLFIVEINNSFSHYQQKIMNNLINKLLKVKNEIKCEQSNEIIDKNKTNEYMDSCIVFIHKNDENTKSLILKEIKKLAPQKFPSINCFSGNLSKNDEGKKLYDNTHIYSSSICGLGKSTKIKKKIKKSGKEYFCLHLGGNLNKNDILNKLKELLIKIETKKCYSNAAIHLILYENNESSIIKEFLFSLLITKFYWNNEYIIYIPKNIEIYIEIPNCFDDFMLDYDILKFFKNENIPLNNNQNIELSEDDKNILEKILKDNNPIEEQIKQYFINKNNLGIPKFSFHQVNIFIQILIGQCKKYNGKIVEYVPISVPYQKDENINKIIKLFIKGTRYFIKGEFAKLLSDGVDRNNKGDYISVLSSVYTNDLEKEKYDTPLIFINKTIDNYIEVNLSDKYLKNKTQEDYLNELKPILSIFNPKISFEKGNKFLLELFQKDNYVITNDNFKKMILILYRISANIPVILMGETGCGKTALIRKLNQLVNNGETFLEIININPCVNDNNLTEKMNKLNSKADIYKGKDFWLFFDELNTCDSLVLITEIFMNRTYNGIELKDNIRLIGACNPYRKGKIIKNYGLEYPNNKNELVYLVNKLPQSLMYYIFNFGSINEEDEKKYISSIISNNLFKNEDHLLIEKTTNIISKCHRYIREKNDISAVSLREISRFQICCSFLKDIYYKNKNKYLGIKNSDEQLEKLKSIIISIYLCYYIRLTDERTRNNFDIEILKEFIELTNFKNEKYKANYDEKSDLLSKIGEPLKSYIGKALEKKYISDFKYFSQILLLEQNFLINEIKLDNGIGINKSLRDNIFLLFISLNTKIPLIIVGKPGSGKSLSTNLLYKVMNGKYSESKFFSEFPPILSPSYLQGSYSTLPEEVENIFETANKKLENLKEKDKKILPISMILFDELGLAEKSDKNPLKVLHKYLDYNDNRGGVSFVGISNWALDAAKNNRAFLLSVPDLDESLDDLQETSIKIAESFDKNFKDNILFKDILPLTYFEYKKFLKDLKSLSLYKKYEWSIEFEDIKKTYPNEKYFNGIKKIEVFMEKKKEIVNMSHSLNKKNKEKHFFSWELTDFYDKNLVDGLKKINENKINLNFHGNRDFYSLIKGIAKIDKPFIFNSEFIIKNIVKSIERNFGGTSIEIDIDTDFQFKEFDKFKKILEQITKYIDINKKKKINSISLFKIIYNYICEENKFKLKIKKEDIKNYNILDNIIDNIESNSRYLLLQIESSLTPLIYQNIVKQKYGKRIYFYEGSPFNEDNGIEYQSKMINLIIEHANNGNIIVLHNLEQIYPFLYDLFNMNYIKRDNKNYARICYGNFSYQYVFIHEEFKCIIMVDKIYINKVEAPFLNRFEKMIISFKKLLDYSQKKFYDEIIKGDLDLKNKLFDIKNYSLKDLLIGCKNKDIKGLIYFLYKENPHIDKEEYKQEIKEKLLKKISKLIPQDIILNLKGQNEIKEAYYKNKEFYNIDQYISFIKNRNDNKYKITIVYTFSKITTYINDNIEEYKPIVLSEIKKESQLKNSIDCILKNNNIIKIHLDSFNSKSLSFLISFINNNYIDEDSKEKKFIILIHIERNFKDSQDDSELDKIFNVPDINDNVYQLFIDNLKGQEIIIEDILNNSVNDIINNKYFDVLSKFTSTLSKFIQSNFSRRLYGKNSYINRDNYYEKFEKFIKLEKNKRKIYFEPFDLINKIKKLNNYSVTDLLKKIYEENFMNIESIDIISVLLDFIKDNIFEKNLLEIFKKLENDNFLTTLLVLEENTNGNIKYDTINKIIKNYIQNLDFKEDDCYKPKFNLDFLIPGFYNFYEECSNLISNKFSTFYTQNENNMRRFIEGDIFEAKKNFHEKENKLLNILYKEIEKNEFIIKCVRNKEFDLDLNLVLKDYISFYFHKYYKIKNNPQVTSSKNFNNLLNLIINLRFNDKTNIIIENKADDFKIILIKILWIESNTNYLWAIYKIIQLIIKINQNDEEIFQKINNIINSQKKRYIINHNEAYENQMEVNECYYIFLGAICSSIFEKFDNIFNSPGGFQCLEEILKILKNLNDDLNIELKEIYIIDEILEVKNAIEKNNLINILNIFIKNNNILQSNDNDKYEKLIDNLNELYDLIINKFSKDESVYKDLSISIFYKEIKKVSDINYKKRIFCFLIKNKEIIVNSNEIFNLLFECVINPEKDEFHEINIISKIKNSDNGVLREIEKILKNTKNKCYMALNETVLYFFEKCSFIYMNRILNGKEKIYLNNTNFLNLFKDCAKYIILYFYDKKKDKDDVKDEVKELDNICKLFCFGFIKLFCYIFIIFIKNDKIEIKYISEIIEVINNINIMELKVKNKENLDKIRKDFTKNLQIYIFKIIYNINGKNMNIFRRGSSIIKKYILEDYIYFKEIKSKDDKINNNQNMKENENNNRNRRNEKQYDNNNDNKNKENEFIKIFEKFKSKDFMKVDITELNIDNNDIDIFYCHTKYLIISYIEGEINDKILLNFYQNICLPKFETDLSNAIKLLYYPEKLNNYKKKYYNYMDTIKIILVSYRYFLNEISKDNHGIFYSLYIKNGFSNIDENYYPGNDISKNNKYFNIYPRIKEEISRIENLKDKGIYICLCDEVYTKIITKNEFMTKNNIKCPFCKKNPKNENSNEFLLIVSKETDGDSDWEKYSITLEKFEKNYIKKKLSIEKGITTNIDKNHLKKDNKPVRNLSQVSFRLLNFILYSHIYFVKIYYNNEKYKKYLPYGMEWEELLNECWELLKNELKKKNINDVEDFMDNIFSDIFPVLNQHEEIEDYEELLSIEKELENIISEKIMNFTYKIDEKEKNDSIISNYYSLNYGEEDNYFDNLFVYSDYINEDFLLKELSHKDDEKYPVLRKYLENNKKLTKENKNELSLGNLLIFNKTLNLVKDKYIFRTSKTDAENINLNDTNIGIYNNNEKLFDEFIDFINKYNENNKNNLPKLSKKNNLIDFLIDEDNEFGSLYKIIYKKFISMQNKEIKKLLDLKIKNKIFSEDYIKNIDIQSAQEDEIFSLDSSNFPFIDIVFNCSYRKVALLDNSKNSKYIYNDYEINYDLLEKKMTDVFLRNKKLFSIDKISDFIYENNFSYKDTDIIARFNELYIARPLEGKEEKISIHKFYENIIGNNKKIKEIITEFKILINYLIRQKEKENGDNKELENLKISEFLKISKIKEECKNLIEIFQYYQFTIDKTTSIFIYYLMVIFNSLSLNMNFEKYQIEIEEEKKKLINRHFNRNDIIIKKEDFVLSTRLFISLFLFNEENKEKEIRNNSKNIIDCYRNIPDIWKCEFQNREGRNKIRTELEEIKKMNINVNQIIVIEELFGKEFEKWFFKEYNDEKLNNQKTQENKDNDSEISKKEIIDNENNEWEDDKKMDEEEEESEEYFGKEEDDDY